MDDLSDGAEIPADQCRGFGLNPVPHQNLPFVNYAEMKEAPFIPSRRLHMDHSLKKRISERAYEIWAAHGRVDGQADQHWLAAEREILAVSTATLPRNAARKRKIRTRRKKRRAPARAKTANTLAVAS